MLPASRELQAASLRARGVELEAHLGALPASREPQAASLKAREGGWGMEKTLPHELPGGLGLRALGGGGLG